MRKNKSRLEPCPFCGGRAIGGISARNGFTFYQVFCTDCGCRTKEYSQIDMAIDKWNRRFGMNKNTRLIDANSLIDDLRFLYDERGNVRDKQAKMVLQVIGEQPTICDKEKHMCNQETVFFVKCNVDYRCPCCNTYNEAWERREHTVHEDIVYCWHCGTGVRLGGI